MSHDDDPKIRNRIHNTVYDLSTAVILIETNSKQLDTVQATAADLLRTIFRTRTNPPILG